MNKNFIKKIFLISIIVFSFYFKSIYAYVVDGGGDPCANCSGGYCSGCRFCSRSCVNNACVTSCSDAAGTCCGSSGSCNYGSWQNIGCGQCGCAANKMCQKSVSSNSSYKKWVCSFGACQRQTVTCPVQYRCADALVCGANIEILTDKITASIGDPIYVTTTIDAQGYGVCENEWDIKINGVTTSKSLWTVSNSGGFSTYSTCRYFTGDDNCNWVCDYASNPCPFDGCLCSYKSRTCQGCGINGRELYCYFYGKKVATSSLSFLAPGSYSFTVEGKLLSSKDVSWFSTSSETITIKALYGKTEDGDPTDVSINKNVILGEDGANITLPAGILLGSQNGNVIIRGNLNLAANASPAMPIRIIYGNQLILAPGSQISLPTSPNLIGGAYIIKAGRNDPYILDSQIGYKNCSTKVASICSGCYDGSRRYFYCGLNQICQMGSCVAYNF